MKKDKESMFNEYPQEQKNKPKNIIKIRKDYEKLMALISTICFLRQYQKELKQIDSMSYIECDLKDYEIAYEIMAETDPLLADEAIRE